MKRQWIAWARRYQAALQKHLQQGVKSCVPMAHRVGRQAVQLGLETLDLARIHKTALSALVRPDCSAATREQMVRRAGIFFNEVISPIEKTHRAGVASDALLHRQNKRLTRRTAQLAMANRHLQQEIIERKTAEEALRKSGQHHEKLLEESRRLQKHLQRFTRQIFSAQENERSKISRDLQNEIAQTLLGINVRLLTLKKGAAAQSDGLAKEIASTQRLVEKSVETINDFARAFGARHET